MAVRKIKRFACVVVCVSMRPCRSSEEIKMASHEAEARVWNIQFLIHLKLLVNFFFFRNKGIILSIVVCGGNKG